MNGHLWHWVTMSGAALFLLFAQFTTSMGLPQGPAVEDRVVISAPIQLLLSGGDRFLAANMETIRSAATDTASGETDTIYRIRAHLMVAQLNPCHEDNYYLGYGLLSWGGAELEANDLMRRAIECRQWDWIPPFFYGFNQYYFHRDIAEAQRAFEIAAQRSPENSASLKKTAIMIATGEIEDDRMALDYLKHQRDQATDAKLRQMLDKRVGRQEGLVAMREAQRHFEKQFNRPLKTPEELVTSGLLDRLPPDPLGIGYEFSNGVFMLRQLKVAGTKEKR